VGWNGNKAKKKGGGKKHKEAKKKKKKRWKKNKRGAGYAQGPSPCQKNKQNLNRGKP